MQLHTCWLLVVHYILLLVLGMYFLLAVMIDVLRILCQLLMVIVILFYSHLYLNDFYSNSLLLLRVFSTAIQID